MTILLKLLTVKLFGNMMKKIEKLLHYQIEPDVQIPLYFINKI